MPLISVILPVFNTERFIRRCLESIVGQSVSDIEIVIVNDATPDRAMDVVREFAQHDSRFVIVDKEKNEGLMMARKTGYELAKGDYIVFCDSDDLLLPDALRILYDKVVSESADIAMSGYRYIEVSGKTTDAIYRLPYGNTRFEVMKALLEEKLPHNLWANIYKRDLFTQYEYVCFANQTLGEDMMLFYQLVNNSNRIVTADCVLYGYCQNMQSSMHVPLSDPTARKWASLTNSWYEFMVGTGLFPKLVDRRVLKSTYYKLRRGCNFSTVSDCSPAFRHLFYYKQYMSILGFRWGLRFFLYKTWREIFDRLS
ncbi:MAG: glycosyltransferase [Alistipes sp.]|nr:glycosyltransferase [Alistipes sp.]